jgi:hypothetical protein
MHIIDTSYRLLLCILKLNVQRIGGFVNSAGLFLCTHEVHTHVWYAYYIYLRVRNIHTYIIRQDLEVKTACVQSK